MAQQELDAQQARLTAAQEAGDKAAIAEAAQNIADAAAAMERKTRRAAAAKVEAVAEGSDTRKSAQAMTQLSPHLDSKLAGHSCQILMGQGGGSVEATAPKNPLNATLSDDYGVNACRRDRGSIRYPCFTS